MPTIGNIDLSPHSDVSVTVSEGVLTISSLDRDMELTLASGESYRTKQVEISTVSDDQDQDSIRSALEAGTLSVEGGYVLQTDDGTVAISGISGLSLAQSATTIRFAEEQAVVEEPVVVDELVRLEIDEQRLIVRQSMTVHTDADSSLTAQELVIEPVPESLRDLYQLDDNQILRIAGGTLRFDSEGRLLLSDAAVTLEDDASYKEEPGVSVLLQDTSFEQSVETSFWPSLGWMLGAGGIILALLAALLVSLLSRRRIHTNTAGPTAQDPPTVPTLRYSKLQNIGARESQQDSFGICAIRGGMFAVVADGMGGLKNGDLVSRKIVKTAIDDCKDASAEELRGNLLSVLSHVNAEINRMLGTSGTYRSGSTMVAVLAEPRQFRWVSVGDSRIYLYRAGKLLQLNREHNHEAELLLQAVNQKISFQEARNHPKKKSLSSFIGSGTLKYIDEMPRAVSTVRGDMILLCSDGVYNALSDPAIEAILASAQNVEDAARKLEAAIVQRKAPYQDNFTAVLLSYE